MTTKSQVYFNLSNYLMGCAGRASGNKQFELRERLLDQAFVYLKKSFDTSDREVGL